MTNIITAAEAQEAWEQFQSIYHTINIHWPEQAPWTSPDRAVAGFSRCYGPALMAKRSRRWRLLRYASLVSAVILATCAFVAFETHVRFFSVLKLCLVCLIYLFAAKREQEIANWEPLGIREDHDSVWKLVARLGQVVKQYADCLEVDNLEFLLSCFKLKCLIAFELNCDFVFLSIVTTMF